MVLMSGIKAQEYSSAGARDRGAEEARLLLAALLPFRAAGRDLPHSSQQLHLPLPGRDIAFGKLDKNPLAKGVYAGQPIKPLAQVNLNLCCTVIWSHTAKPNQRPDFTETVDKGDLLEWLAIRLRPHALGQERARLEECRLDAAFAR